MEGLKIKPEYQDYLDNKINVHIFAHLFSRREGS